VGRKIFRGRGDEKNSKNSKNDRERALLGLFQGEGERPKNSKKIPKNSTIKLLSIVPCIKIQGGMTPAANARG